MNTELFANVDHYLEALFVPQDEALEAALRDMAAAGLPSISVSPNQGKILHMLALLCGARTILEIGTLGGYSAIWLARALPTDGRLVTIEHSTKHAEVARKNIARAGLADRVEIRIGRALDLLPKFEAERIGPFDMVFIDADKSPYTEYFQWSLHLTRPGGLIIADNVIRSGDVIDANTIDANLEGIRRFNAALAAESRVTATILPIAGVKGYDGMALAIVRG